MTLGFKPGDRVILARHSKAQGDFGISHEDYGKSGTVVGKEKYYHVLLDHSTRNLRRMDAQGRRLTWKVTEDQLDLEEGPW